MKPSQVSFGSPPASPSNRKRYGSLFSTAPSERALGRAAGKLLQVYSWTRVGLVAPPEVTAARWHQLSRRLGQLTRVCGRVFRPAKT